MIHLYEKNNRDNFGFQWSTGSSAIYFLHECDECVLSHEKIITAVQCEFVPISMKYVALLDTGSELSVVGKNAYELFSETDQMQHLAPVGAMPLS